LSPGVIELVSSSALNNGGEVPDRATFVRTTRFKALKLANDPPGPSDADGPVVVVEVSGRFSGGLAHAPAGQKPPSGSVIDLVIDEANATTLDFYLGDASLDLASLGTVDQMSLS
jgi:hypothetical protein